MLEGVFEAAEAVAGQRERQPMGSGTTLPVWRYQHCRRWRWRLFARKVLSAHNLADFSPPERLGVLLRVIGRTLVWWQRSIRASRGPPTPPPAQFGCFEALAVPDSGAALSPT